MASAETNSVRVRMSGVARSSAEAHAHRSGAYLSGLGSERAVPMPRRFEPLYVDDAGASYLIRPGADGPVAIPFAAPPKGTPWEQEGLLPFPDPPPPSAAPTGAPQPPREPGPFDRVKNEIRDWAKALPSQMGQAVVKQALMNAFLGKGTDGLLGAALGPLGGVLGGLAPAVGSLGSMLGSLSAASGGADALGFVAGGCFPGMGSGADAKPILPGGCFPGSTSGVDVSVDLSATLGQLGSQLLSQWKVEDSDVMGEQFAHHFAEKWKDKLSDPEGTLNKLKAFFAPTAAPALFPALRVSDVDVAGDAVAAGSPTVFAEGLPVARVTDAVAPPGMQLYMGGATVLTNGMMTGRALTSMSMIGPFPKGAATVFVNGAAGGAPPPPPPPSSQPTAQNQAKPMHPAFDDALGGGSPQAGNNRDKQNEEFCKKIDLKEKTHGGQDPNELARKLQNNEYGNKFDHYEYVTDSAGNTKPVPVYQVNVPGYTGGVYVAGSIYVSGTTDIGTIPNELQHAKDDVFFDHKLDGAYTKADGSEMPLLEKEWRSDQASIDAITGPLRDKEWFPWLIYDDWNANLVAQYQRRRDALKSAYALIEAGELDKAREMADRNEGGAGNYIKDALKDKCKNVLNSHGHPS